MKASFREIIEDTPIIAAVNNEEGLKRCLESEIQVVFILFGNICTITDIVRRVKETGKIAMIHLDLVEGLSGKDVVLDYIKEYTMADGIITTKNTLIKHAKELGFYTILRYFVVDSRALSNIEKQNSGPQPDMIEVLPGIVPKIIKKVNKISKVPVIAGGLVAEREDVMTALNSGAMAISTTSHDVWFM